MFKRKSTSEEVTGVQIANKLADQAEANFSQGFNCCESVIKAAIETLDLPLPSETYRMGSFFRRGVAGTGCICGALAGGIMMLGYIAGEKGNQDLAEKFRQDFVERFGSTCCRVIRKKQSITERFWAKECQEITRFAGAKLQEVLDNNR